MAQCPGGPVQCLENREPSSLIGIPFAAPFRFQVYHAGICGDVWQNEDHRLAVFLPDLPAGRKQFGLEGELSEGPAIHPQPMASLEEDIKKNLNDHERVNS